MSRIQSSHRLQVPATLESQLRDFRSHVWAVKMLEAAGIALASLLAGYLCVFVLDRFWNTPSSVRTMTLLAAMAGGAVIPVYLHRWVWRRRRLEQLARLLGRKLPRVGDQLLGVLELAASDAEQHRSRALCQAAIENVAADSQQRDFRTAAPNAHQLVWSCGAGVALVLAVTLAVLLPGAATNSWQRFLTPWKNISRFTFAAVETMPPEIVVAHGEPFSLTAHLKQDSSWQPDHAFLQVGQHDPIRVSLTSADYQFTGPALLEPMTAEVTVGDWYQRIQIVPKLRPELTHLEAEVQLPEYLGKPESFQRDVRGGGISLVRGSRVSFAAAASRGLSSASIDGEAARVDSDKFRSGAYEVDAPRKVILNWQDEFGLAGREPFTISVGAEEDAPPSVGCQDLPRRRVVLDSEQLVFHVTAHDDFGVQQVGMEWRGVGGDIVEEIANGEQILAPGGHDEATLDVEGAFTAQSLGITPQPIELRVFVTDYYPNRDRVYSAPYLLYVLDANQHAIWVTEQLAKWQRQALEVRDREMRLYEANKRIRAMSAEELDRPEIRRTVEDQAAAERANGRRLASLSMAGEELLRQAARNPEIGVGHLDRWAEILQILQDISANRMPSVADLLKEASQAVAATSSANLGRQVGQARALPANRSASTTENNKRPSGVPSLVDMESTQQPFAPDGESQEPQKKNPSSPSLRLPVTTLMGQAKNGEPSPARKKVDQAVVEQKDLLAEFEKVANELNEVLANLEGSTLVKRLKAASREQYRIAGRLIDQVEGAFGGPVKQGAGETLDNLVERESSSSQTLSYIMDDIEAYFERRRLVRFKTILDEMRSEDVVGALRQVANEMPREQGLSISQCEYWSDTLDRWAEDLVDPACSGQCPGCRSKGSLPPSIVLEVLKILEGEVNLREETRVAEQARPAIEADKHTAEAQRLAKSQQGLDERTVKVVERIRQLPDAEMEFGKELALLAEVSGVMGESTEILNRPETGPPAIAAETEVIELLLRSKRINPNGGGGSGSSPGGGGGGDTQDSALALLGAGLNQQEVRENREPEQSVGKSGETLPAEFRAGLDQYFSELERGSAGG